jgi:hypothetical protein
MKRNETKRNSIGLLVGTSKGGKIENCHASGKIKISGKEKNSNIGGIVGYAENTQIKDCYSEVTIEEVDEIKFEEIKNIIKKQVKDEKIMESLLRQVEELKDAINKKSYTTKYKKFISTASQYMSIISPFVPFLTKFIK